MTPSRPYLIRALYDWIVDNDLTPYALVDVARGGDRLAVPEQFIEDGKIVFNLSPSAVRNLELTNEAITFDGRFRGVPHQVFVPVSAVMAIYAKENGRGMVFPDEEGTEPPDDGGGDEGDKTRRPALRVVK